MCALVTGVQTCALPIYSGPERDRLRQRRGGGDAYHRRVAGDGDAAAAAEGARRRCRTGRARGAAGGDPQEGLARTLGPVGAHSGATEIPAETVAPECADRKSTRLTSRH